MYYNQRRFAAMTTVAVFVLLANPVWADTPLPAVTRAWTDSTGRHHMNGSLIGGDRELVQLRRIEGDLISVPVARLCDVDRQYVLMMLQQRTPADEPGANKNPNSVTAKTEAVASSIFSDVGRWWPKLTMPYMQNAFKAATATPLLSEASETLPPNMIYVRLSGPFLQRMAWHDVFHNSVIDDQILNAHVIGAAHTTGHTEFKLLSRTQAGLAELRLFGTTHTSTIGYSGPVRIHSTGQTEFQSTKCIWIDAQGIHTSPACTTAQAHTTVNNIETTLPRLRGRISLRIAGQRVAESHGQSEQIAAQHTAQRVNTRFDATTNDQVNQLWKKTSDHLAALSADNPLRPRSIQASSSEQALQLVVYGGQSDSQPASTAPPTSPSPADIEVCVHVSAVRRAIADTELNSLLGPAMFRLAAMPRTIPIDAPNVRWTADGKWLSINWQISDAAIAKSRSKAAKAN